MKVYVNDEEIECTPGMKVSHALISVNLLEEAKRGAKVTDEWGNDVGLDGALTEGMKIEVQKL
jgi:hypothetical protein